MERILVGIGNEIREWRSSTKIGLAHQHNEYKSHDLRSHGWLSLSIQIWKRLIVVNIE